LKISTFHQSRSVTRARRRKWIFTAFTGALCGQGLAGSVQGIREIADRLDGKVPQAIAGIDEHENLTPLTATINLGRTQPKSPPKAVGGVRKRSDGDPRIVAIFASTMSSSRSCATASLWHLERR